MKKRLLCLMASLLLCGAAIAQEPAYVRAHDNNMPVVAQVVLDGTAVTTSEWTLKAYIGDDQRGEAVIQTSLNNTYWIQVYYSTDTEDNTPVTFKIANADNPEGFTCETTLNTLAEGYGTPGTPQPLSFASTQTMTNQLAAGWSWWSSPLELSNNGLAMLEESLGTSGIKIQSKNSGFTEYYDFGTDAFWYGTLTAIYNEQMYQVSTSDACASSMTGQVTNPESHPIPINNGWNWIGFPCNNSQPVQTAMSGFTPTSGDQIKSKNSGFTEYYDFGTDAFWYGTLNTLEPWQGYMYLSNSNETKTLVYQTQANRDMIESSSIGQSSVFMSKEDNYANNMTIIAVIELGNSELRNSEFEVAAFAGDECRGSVKLMYIEPIDRYLAFLLVSGEAKENLNFVLTDGNDYSWSTDHLMYITDASIGSLTEPTVLHFAPLGIEENNQSIVNVYPNPSKGIFNVKGKDIRKIEIINAFGQIILSKEVNEDTDLFVNLSDQAIGAYLLRVITDNGITTKQLIKD